MKRHPIGTTMCDILYVLDRAEQEDWSQALTVGRLRCVLPEHSLRALQSAVQRLRRRGLVVYRRAHPVRLTKEGRRWLEAWPEVPGGTGGVAPCEEAEVAR